MMHSVTITSQGQITIPAKIRKILFPDNTRKAILELEEDKVIMRPEPDIMDLYGVFKTKKKIPFKKAREAFENYLATRSVGKK